MVSNPTPATPAVAGNTLGTTLGFYGATPVTQPARPTQVPTTGATQTTPFGYSTAGQANGIVVAVNAILNALSTTSGGNGLIA